MRNLPFATAALAATLGAVLSGCAGVPTNRSMYSVHQPVVEKTSYSLDLTTAGGGLAYGEQARLAGWFETLGLKYGDRILVDDPDMDPTTRNAVAMAAQRFGLVIDDASAPTGTVPSGVARITVSRAVATVPGCPDWSVKSDGNPNNGLSSNYGCATNSNLAAMVADPEDLVRGQNDTGSTAAMTSNRAISAYRTAPATGQGNTVSQTSTSSTGGGN
ncbi:CpaD family pilus assembly protein [Novosphingobium panipatense]|uniref:Pilus assembly protein CpaD n=1 Tax=Novosphingobium panipatense TaxID=428991 RepID=A0ABY1PXZ1_9SPHN|nr:CpaD family pilus assembly protein [Novosphingobium panipatense]SMP52584.1 pilus assembly protein CpaD [Novosphingobium panipatense]